MDENKVVKDTDLGWVSETGKTGGDQVGYRLSSGRILYRVAKEAKNCFALWREPMYKEPIGYYISSSDAMAAAQELEDHKAELVQAIESLKVTRVEPASSEAAPAEQDREALCCQGDCRPPSAWERVRRFITGGAR